jgi:hypothetical protein
MNDSDGRIFISYSQDSLAHSTRVLDLANQLRSHGIDVEIDQYIDDPSQGWPTWMLDMVTTSRYVLLVPSEGYAAKLNRRDHSTLGRGARWEGAIITQILYENQGLESKIIPILMGENQEEYIPIFLRGRTFYIISREDDYLKLYRRLTNQRGIIKPALGQRLILAPAIPTMNAGDRVEKELIDYGETQPVLVVVKSGALQFLQALEISVGDTISITLTPQSDQQAAFVRQMAHTGRTQEIGIAFGLEALFARVLSVQEQYVGPMLRQTISLSAVPPRTNMIGEIAYGRYSADQIAELRARRILLNERLRADNTSDFTAQLNEATLEVFVRGNDSVLKIRESPLPALYGDTSDDPAGFLVAARLVATFYLRLSNTVEHINQLEMKIASPGRLQVQFSGTRSRAAVNVRPSVITILGECDLLRDGPNGPT